ncbi:PH domain-containing protein [Amycolatopsis nigrescens]|uniref:PH domain-containing protein n=1 Tax=Amycolatopsis nigrescens TaxID=381445 RepID=UPI00037DA68D|nr:PH domain-containing protein [Amycolatopsis nigrescens]
MAEKTQRDQAEPGGTAVFRIPATALLAIMILVICVTPVAFGGVPGLQALYLVPLGLLLFVQRTRTTASRDGLAVRTMFGSREIPWAALKGLALTKKSKVRAVLTDDSQIQLPAVRTRHLPVLALVSGGKVPDPSGLTEEMTKQALAERAAEAEAAEQAENPEGAEKAAETAENSEAGDTAKAEGGSPSGEKPSSA